MWILQTWTLTVALPLFYLFTTLDINRVSCDTILRIWFILPLPLLIKSICIDFFSSMLSQCCWYPFKCENINSYIQWYMITVHSRLWMIFFFVIDDCLWNIGNTYCDIFKMVDIQNGRHLNCLVDTLFSGYWVHFVFLNKWEL